jgi:CDP-diacylglycerol---serine O-phosphatidyltransferase
MRKLKKEKTYRNLSRTGRKEKLNYIAILPSLVTILNCLCGFAAIVFAANGEFTTAGYMVFLAMLADAMDGRLARSVESVSNFGVQLDSLCDVISFGLAPAFLMLKVMESELKLDTMSLQMGNLVQRFIWVAAAAYTCCAVIRLARFNVENPDDSSDHLNFVGLPSPAAAGVLVSLILFQQTYAGKSHLPNLIVIDILPYIALGVAMLMISRVHYPHVLNQYLRGKRSFSYLIQMLLVLVFIVCFPFIALVSIFCGFAVDGFVRWLYQNLQVERRQAWPEQQDLPKNN